jgi:NTE family protein
LARSQTLPPSTIRKQIEAGQVDARISLNKMEIIFGIEDLISDGIMSIEEGDKIIKEAREVVTTEQLLQRKREEEAQEAYNRYVKRIEAKDISSERKETLIRPGRDNLSLVMEANTKR